MNLITIKEVSTLVNLTPDEIRDLISKGLFPEPFGKVGSILRWSTIEIKQWVRNEHHN